MWLWCFRELQWCKYSCSLRCMFQIRCGSLLIPALFQSNQVARIELRPNKMVLLWTGCWSLSFTFCRNAKRFLWRIRFAGFPLHRVLTIALLYSPLQGLRLPFAGPTLPIGHLCLHFLFYIPGTDWPLLLSSMTSVLFPSLSICQLRPLIPLWWMQHVLSSSYSVLPQNL